MAIKDANELYKAGEGKLGTNESEFIRILCSRSFDHLNMVAHEYSRLSKNSLEKAIQKEMSGNLEKGYYNFPLLFNRNYYLNFLKILSMLSHIKIS